jgi:hypothetical protein
MSFATWNQFKEIEDDEADMIAFKNSQIRSDIDEVLDFCDFKKSRGSTTSFDSCINIAGNDDTKEFLTKIHQFSKLYEDKKEFLAVVEKIAEME